MKETAKSFTVVHFCCNNFFTEHQVIPIRKADPSVIMSSEASARKWHFNGDKKEASYYRVMLRVINRPLGKRSN